MAQQAELTLQEALGAFDFGARAPRAARYGEGHINDTFLVGGARSGSSFSG